MRIVNIFVIACLLLLSLCSLAQDESGSIVANGNKLSLSSALGRPELNSADVLILQFHQIPTALEKTIMAKEGITLLRYLSGNAYLARVSAVIPPESEVMDYLKAGLPYTPELKISRRLGDYLGSEADSAGCNSSSYYIRVFPGIDFSDVSQSLRSVGIAVDQRGFKYNRALYLWATPEQIAAASRLPEVEVLDLAMSASGFNDPTVDKRLNVRGVRQQKRFNKADGANSLAGWWDSPVSLHDDLKGRVTQIHVGTEQESGHGTGTAGIAIGSGKNDSKAKGIAPGGKIISYNPYYSEAIPFDFRAPDFLDQFKDAVTKYKVGVSNHSWGDDHGWKFRRNESGGIDGYWIITSGYGVYNHAAHDQDKFARENDVLIVRSSGNERAGGYLGSYFGFSGDYMPVLNPDGSRKLYSDIRVVPDYFTVAHRMTSKNIVVVGAVMHDEMLTNFSNAGPTNGYVLKPDLVSQGAKVYTTGTSNSYQLLGGTSSACPIVTGAAMLLDDYYFRTHGVNLDSTTLKALLLHSARDIGAAGPDYLTGFGVPDVELGAKLLQNSTTDPKEFSQIKNSKKNRSRALILRGKVAHKQRLTYQVIIPGGSGELRATLVWKDAPGEKLINNLDMWMTGNTRKKLRPFALDPKKPEELAKRKRNKYDNVEHILLENPETGTYKIFVKGSKIPDGPQEFSVVFSVSQGNSEQKDISLKGDVEIQRVFISREKATREDESGLSALSLGDEFYLNALLNVKENHNYGSSLYGSVALKFLIKDAKGKTVFKYNKVRTDLSSGTKELVSQFNSIPLVIPESMAKGEYTFSLLVEMVNALKVEKSVDFLVE